MTFAQLSDSKLADNAPEILAAGFVAALIFAGIWKLVSKLQEGQKTIVAQFLGHIEKAERRQEAIAEGNRDALERVQMSLDKNTLMLGKTGAALERATNVIDRLERQLESKQRDYE